MWWSEKISQCQVKSLSCANRTGYGILPDLTSATGIGARAADFRIQVVPGRTGARKMYSTLIFPDLRGVPVSHLRFNFVKHLNGLLTRLGGQFSGLIGDTGVEPHRDNKQSEE